MGREATKKNSAVTKKPLVLDNAATKDQYCAGVRRPLDSSGVITPTELWEEESRRRFCALLHPYSDVVRCPNRHRRCYHRHAYACRASGPAQPLPPGAPAMWGDHDGRRRGLEGNLELLVTGRGLPSRLRETDERSLEDRADRASLHNARLHPPRDIGVARTLLYLARELLTLAGI